MTNVLFNAPVKVYRMSTPEHQCPWGLWAIKLLTEHGIPFEDILLRSQENRRKARKPLGFRQEVPTANLFALIFNRDTEFLPPPKSLLEIGA
ncbi:hypothetical protein ACRYJJ_07565 [Cylindrospermopsis raciborskii G7]|uniref:hypothetical protein n=1 Tax=Cylindrospermopsis raciborskii TaxID=77022 RepID=UPI003EBF0CAB